MLDDTGLTFGFYKRKEARQWHSFSKPPKVGKRVMVTLQTGYERVTAIRIWNGKEWVKDYTGGEVVAWTYLEDPYEGKLMI